MSAGPEPLGTSVEELYEDAPCGLLSARPDGTLVRVNRTLERLTGRPRDQLLGAALQDLLSVPGRIHLETHVVPRLHLAGEAREIAVELVRPDGSRLPALLGAVLHREAGRPPEIRATVLDASDRRRYEQELRAARDRERQVALELQRSLLAGALPTADGLELGVTLRPGVRGLEVGGDWYDAFWLEEPVRVGLVVGDVVGRGIAAAAAAGQLRSAVRALASTGLRPGALLEALDGFAHRHAVGRMATVAVGELDLPARRLRFACAGHPPPVVLEPGGGADVVRDGRSLPLDAFGTGERPRPEGVRDLAAGATVLLYTDGLVERRTAPVEDGIRLLAAEADRRRATAPAALAQDLARDLADPEHADDVCLLAVRVGAALEVADAR